MKTTRHILPATAGNQDHGSRVANTIFLLIAVVGIVRSCIHLFSPDGGAGSIAGLDVTVAGGDAIIFAFALWGGAQLLLAIVQLIVYFRYKNLIPFMYILLIAEIFTRVLAGWLHPVTFSHVPPGAIANYVLLAVAAAMLLLILASARHSRQPGLQG